MDEKGFQLNPLYRSSGHDVENESVDTHRKHRGVNDTQNGLSGLQQRKVSQKGFGGSPLAFDAKKTNFDRHKIRIAVSGSSLGIILFVSSVILSVSWSFLDRSANQQNFRILVDTSRLTMERLEGVTSDAESRAVALAAISRSLPDNATLGQRLELLQKLTNLMKTATRNVKRNPMEAIYAGYYVLKESGMVTGIEVTWDILCSGMYFCWGTAVAS